MKISRINKIIENPQEARDYIRQFMRDLGKDYYGGFVETNTRKILFIDMTDEDAIFVANQFQGMTAEAEKNRNTRVGDKK